MESIIVVYGSMSHVSEPAFQREYCDQILRRSQGHVYICQNALHLLDPIS